MLAGPNTVITDARMQLFLDTVRIGNLLTEHSRVDRFAWAREGKDNRFDPPDPTCFRTSEGWVIQTVYNNPHLLRALICPWGTWFCFEAGTHFNYQELLPHLEFTQAPHDALPYPIMRGTFHYLTHFDGNFLGKPELVEWRGDSDDASALMMEWNELMERNGVQIKAL